MLAPSMALAPRRDLLSVPSRSMRVLSICTWRSTSMPVRASAISLLTCSTALVTPLPPKRFLSPSRISSASRLPVDAPEGTAALALWPDSSVTSTSTVGLPRESRISRPKTEAMLLMMAPFALRAVIAKKARERRGVSGPACPAVRSTGGAALQARAWGPPDQRPDSHGRWRRQSRPCPAL